MIRNIVAVERDGFNVKTLTVAFEVPDEQFNLLEAIKKASTDYCKTPAGICTKEYTCGAFNLGDFEQNVDNSFCEKYGFKKIDARLSDIEIDWDHQFIDEDDWDCETNYLH